jgi:type VI protein secretion system component VasF
LADVLEVYLLCLTLGFEGKYSEEKKSELHGLMERSRSRIEGIRQNRGKPLSPEAQLPEDVIQPTTRKSNTGILMKVTLGAAIGALVVFIAAWIHLTSGVSQVLKSLK